MCSNTNSFRAVYDTTRKLQHTPSYNRKFETGRLTTLDASHMSNRRYANDAIREFIKSIDIYSLASSEQLYSCKLCEVDLQSSDLKQLGLNE